MKMGSVPISRKWGLTPFFCLLVACGTAPAPQAPQPLPAAVSGDADSDDRAWDGSGGAPTIRNRGDALVAAAMALRGARYHFGGATPAGFDCSGLVFYVHRQLGLTVPRTSRDQADAADSVKPRKLQRGDLVFFKIRSRHVNHVGIYIGERRFVHAPGAGRAVAVSSLDDEFYADTFSSAGRFWDRVPE